MIEWASPWGLLALGSIALIIWLHFLRPRRTVHTVSTLSLWREALRERERRFGVSRLLRDLSLLLLVTIALLLSLALADPRYEIDSNVSRDTVLVLDASASMQARDGLSSRFERAREQARALIDRLPSGGRMILMTSARRGEIRSRFETQREVLHAALAQLTPTDEVGNPEDAMTLALSLLRGRDQGQVHFITDGAFELNDAIRTPQIRIHRIGKPARNIAITRFDVRREIGSDVRYQVLLTVRNYTNEAVRVPTTVSHDDKVLLERVFTLTANESVSEVMEIDHSMVGRATAEIDVEDDLALDNQAYAALNADETLQVLLVTRGNFFLESVLTAFASVNVSRAAALEAADIERIANEYDVVVADGVPLAPLTRGRYLLINTDIGSLPVTDGGIVQRPVISGRSNSALIDNMDLSGLTIDRARVLTLNADAAGAQRLFWADEGELALAFIRDELRVAYLGFDLAQSNFPLQAAFPLFVARALQWLSLTANRETASSVSAGTPLSLHVPGTHAEVTLRRPSGDAEILELEDSLVVVPDTRQVGIYRYTAAGIRRYFAVNLLDEHESNLHSRIAGADDGSFDDSGRDSVQVTLALWPWLAMAALIALLIEWGLRCLGGRRA